MSDTTGAWSDGVEEIAFCWGVSVSFSSTKMKSESRGPSPPQLTPFISRGNWPRKRGRG